MNPFRRWLLAAWIMVMTVAWIISWVAGPDLVLPFGLAEVGFLAVGGVLAVRVRGNLIGPVLVIGASLGLLYDVGTVYAAYSVDRVTPLPLEHFAAWIGAWTGPISYLTMPLLLVLFPDGHFGGRRRWFLPLFALIIGTTIVGAVLIWNAPATVLIDQAGGGAIADHPGYELIGSAFLPSALLTLPAAISLFLRFRRGSLIERQQIRWLLTSVVAIPIVWIFGSLLLSDDDVALQFLVSGLPLVALPVAIGVAVLRYRLYELDRIVSRTIAYAFVVGVLGVGVVLVSAVAGAQFDEPLVVAATTLGVAALFNPLRKRIQRWVDRRFYRSRYDAEKVIADFTASLRDQVDANGLIVGWVSVVAETMHPDQVGLWLRERSP